MSMAAVIAAMVVANHQLLEDDEDDLELDDVERKMKEEEKRIEGDD